LRTRVPGVAAEMHYADLSHCDEIVRLAGALLDTAARIDVLLNNAGAFFASREIMPDGLERSFALNHKGYFCLAALLRPRLIASAPPRLLSGALVARAGSPRRAKKSMSGSCRWRSTTKVPSLRRSRKRSRKSLCGSSKNSNRKCDSL